MSKIPEGATHQALNGGYRKFVNGLWFGYCDGYWVRVRGDSICEFKPLTKIQSEPEWTGEGVPPSGTACEMRRVDYVNVDWQKIEFLFAGSKKAFFRDEQGHEWSRPLSDLKFRPIRTPEQIAAENRDAAIKEMQRLVGSCNTFPFADLYDYGYRLQVAE